MNGYHVQQTSIADNTEELCDRVRSHIRLLGSSLRQQGLEISEFRDREATLERFKQHSIESQSKIEYYLSHYARAVDQIKNRPSSNGLRADLSLFWHFTKELGLRPTSDLFQHLNSSDVLEIYDPSGFQLYCSVNFFPLSSYSIEEFATYSWHELYDRDQEVTGIILDQLGKVLQEKAQGIHWLTTPIHEVREKFGPKRFITTIRQKLFSPLYNSHHEPSAFVHVFEVIGRREQEET